MSKLLTLTCKQYKLSRQSATPLNIIIDKRNRQILFPDIDVPDNVKYLKRDSSLWARHMIMISLLKEMQNKYRWCTALKRGLLEGYIPQIAKFSLPKLKTVNGKLCYVIEKPNEDVKEFLMRVQYIEGAYWLKKKSD